MSSLDHRTGLGGPPAKSFALDRQNGKVFGVCAGLAHYFGIDPLVVRAIFAIGTIVGFGSFLLIYLAIALIAD